MTNSTGKPSPNRQSFNGKRKRVRNWTSDDRAAHRVFEKGRREAFNDNLIDLARELPRLATTRRLNKHMIVQESLSRHKQQRELCLAAAMQIQELIKERNALLDDLNVWRATQMDLFPPQLPRAVDEPLLQKLSKVPYETFGTFPNGFGDNTTGEDQDVSNANQWNVQQEEAEDFTSGEADSDRPEISNCVTQLPPTIDESEVIPEGHMSSSGNHTYYDPGFNWTLVPPVFIDFCDPIPQH